MFLTFFVRLTLKLGLCVYFLCGTVASKVDPNGNVKDLNLVTRNPSYILVILNQNEAHHIQRARMLKRTLLQNAEANNIDIHVKISSEDLRDTTSWIYLPLAENLLNENIQGHWYIFIEEYCQVNLKKLDLFLRNHDENQELFFGKSLQDKAATIIHHFDSVDHKTPFLYPDPRTGIIISRGLLKRIASEWSPENSKVDFSIDASYEFSKVIFGLGIKLTHVEEVCVEEAERCFVWLTAVEEAAIEERNSVPLSRIHFAVKTCHKYAQERLGVLKDTWLPLVPHYGLYSDVEDAAFGTISVNIPNVERGHCGKTLAIIRRAAKMSEIDWLLIVDDDTLLSVSRLWSFLSLYDPSFPLAIGERYGYMVGFPGSGIDYLTGGAGMVLSKAAVSLLTEEGRCVCPSNDTPDDMYLGACLRRARVPLIHCRRFHQARPYDYAPSLLKDSAPISFHKYWNLDPREAYEQWLADPHANADTPLQPLNSQGTKTKTVRKLEEL